MCMEQYYNNTGCGNWSFGKRNYNVLEVSE
jgi:hypothetical protein